ncbi:MAG: hypothetical protein GY927_15470 [bacterium]|nr:hypothetical protein [bacterium]
MLNFLRRLRSSPPVVTQPPLASLGPILAVLDVYFQQTVEWFADESPEVTSMALETLNALVQASPQPTPTSTSPIAFNPIDWLPKAFETVQRLATEGRPPATIKRWRYLVFARVLCDALEAAYTRAGEQHIPLICPFTPPDPSINIEHLTQPNELLIKSRPKPRFDYRLYQGFGNLIAAQKFPAEGRGWLAEAGRAGIDWFSSEAFWAAYPSSASDPATTPPPDQEAPTGSRLNAPVTPPPSSNQNHSLVENYSPVEKPPSAIKRGHTAAPSPSMNCDVAYRLTQAVSEGIRVLTARSTFNRCGGDGWLVGDTLWVVAKVLALQIQQDDLLQEWPHVLAQRTTLYQALVNHGVAIPHGKRITWKIVVDENGQYQQATVLKFSAALIWPQQAERPSEFGGVVRMS